jgi:GT2 family glycosyltransferase/glycosyltransferase involved in cell wall biosynthesis
MIRTFERSYAGLNRFLHLPPTGVSVDRTPITVPDFLAHDRVSFLPLILREEDAYLIRDLVGAPSWLDEPASTASSTMRRGDDLLALVRILWDAARFSELHGILVLLWPENPAARDAFECLGLGSCLYVGADELLRAVGRVARLGIRDAQPGGGTGGPGRSEPSAQCGTRFDLVEMARDGGWILHEPGETASPHHGGVVHSGPADRSIGTMVTEIFEQEFHALELRHQILQGRKRIESLTIQLEESRRAQRELEAAHNRLARFFARGIARIGRFVLPAGSYRRRGWNLGVRFAETVVREGVRPALSKTASKVRGKVAAVKSARRLRLLGQIPEGRAGIPGESPVTASRPNVTVDVVICIHNALEDVRRCLDSVVRHSSSPYCLILVDDGSGPETAEYVASFAHAHGSHLIRNEIARGYTMAANQGLRQSAGEFVVLLNSDTVVSAEWIDRLVACALSDRRIGLVGALSNTASWQSIPELFSSEGDWALNPLDDGASVDDMARMVARYSGRLYPRLTFLNGFCLMIRRAVLDQVGLFDEEGFGRGYGEENDYCLRAGTASWQLAVADDVYVYHRQSRSYSNERRKSLSEQATATLLAKHGNALVDAGVKVCRENRLLEGIRNRARWMCEREDVIGQGRARWKGRRVLFILPVTTPGGGANVIIQEAEAMRSMGVDAQLFNYCCHRPIFEASYPGLNVPVVYRDTVDALLGLASQFDALIASIYFSVRFLAPLQDLERPPVLGYYIQDYEPHFFRPGNSEYREARNSYTLVPEMIRFTKTEWNRDEVRRLVGVDCHVVGPSVNLDLFRPRPRSLPPPPGVTRIAAMIRPSTSYRQPGLTMKVLEQIYRDHRGSVEFRIFGCDSLDPEFLNFPRRFPWTNRGLLSPFQLCSLLNEVDVFADFSSYQAMGLTAMEAMASGATVIVPKCGGAESVVSHERNGLVVDSSSFADCALGLSRLVEDEPLRKRLQNQAMNDVCRFFPERAAFNILYALFPGP